VRHHSHHHYFAAKIFENAGNKQHDNKEQKLDLLIGNLKASFSFEIVFFFFMYYKLT